MPVCLKTSFKQSGFFFFFFFFFFSEKKMSHLHEIVTLSVSGFTKQIERNILMDFQNKMSQALVMNAYVEK